MKNFLLTKFLLMLFSLQSVAQNSWHVNTPSCSTIEVSCVDLNRNGASVLLYEKNNGFYVIKQSLRLEAAATSVSFTDLPSSIYRTVIIFDQKYEGEYTLWNTNVNTSADIHINCLQFRNDKTTLPLLLLEPNPVTNTLHIKVDNKENEIIYSNIFSANGSLVKQFILTESQKDIHLEDIPSGTYYLQLFINKITITKKFIKI